MSDNPHIEWRKAMETNETSVFDDIRGELRPGDMAAQIVLSRAAALAALSERDALRKALSELLDAFEAEPNDLMSHEYEAIVSDAKTRARAALSKAGA